MRVVALFVLLGLCAAKEFSQDVASMEQMGTAQLLEMREDLKAKLESGEEASPDEKKFYLYFKQMIINTSLKNINDTFAEDQLEVKTAWDATVKCDTDLKRQRDGEWTKLSQNVTQNHDAVKECKNTTTDTDVCDTCDDLISDLIGSSPPQAPMPVDRVPVFHDWLSSQKDDLVFYGDANTYNQLKNWYELYNQWHCSEDFSCPVTDPPSTMTKHKCIKACVEECKTVTTNHIANQAECDASQSTFERSVCLFNSDVTHTCAAWKECRENRDPAYASTKKNVADNEARRKIEYKIMMTIICYIDLMVENAKITAEQKTGCEKEGDTSFLDITYYDVGTAWPGVLDCKCDVLPSPQACPPLAVHAAWGLHHPTPCSTEFVGEWYGSLPYSEKICNANSC